jgi:predicted enzyme related to lactoylglutathione lyase
MLNRIRTVIYHVDDLQEAKFWYIQFTGLQPYFDEPFYVGFDIHGFELGLDPDGTQFTEGNHTLSYWSVDDIHAVVEKAVSIGAQIIAPVNNIVGTIEVATIKDPFGNHIGLITGA